MTGTENNGTTTPAVSIIAPELQIIDGHVTTTSLQVAEHFEKTHKSVLRAIGNIGCSEDFRRRNFAPSSYINEQGKEQPCYRLTRDGFVSLAMGFTGKEAWQWKEAYIDTFNKMEAALTTSTPDKISPAQAQHLKELVDIIVASGKQDYPSTWARFQRKFKVNEYKLLHPSQFDAACEYLRGKMDGQSMAALVQKHFPDATKMVPAPAQQQLQLDAPEQLTPNTYQKLCEGQVREALNMGLVMAGYVQQAVAKAVLRGGDDWKQLRWIVSFVTDNKYAAPVMVDRIEPDAIMVRNTELDQLASACNNLLAQRMQLAAN